MDTGQPPRSVYTVSELSREIRHLIERQFSDVWVEGEVSNVRSSAAGHIYFTFKDDHAQLPAVCFRNQARYLRFRPADGESFRARGRVGTYEARGEYQVLVDILEPTGRGALQAAFEKLRGKLESEGLFDPAHKRALPGFPTRIGVITSPGSAALHDILSVLERRNSSIDIWVYPTEVQGRTAAAELRRAVEYLGAADVDVVVLARGGGSAEDLWPFNDEALARAVFACARPVISAVGHERDFVMTDFVADVRAPTPSAAAELVARSKQEVRERLAHLDDRLVRSMRFRLMELGRFLSARAGGKGFAIAEQRLRQMAQRVDDYSFRLAAFARSGAFFRTLAYRVEHGEGALRRGIARRGTEARQGLLALATRLDALSPLAVLERGYSVCRKPDGTILRRAGDASVGEPLEILLSRGRLDVEIRGVRGGVPGSRAYGEEG